MTRFKGISRSEVSINTNLETALKSLLTANKVYVDTETMGFQGLCFLIQFSTDDNPRTIHIIRVLKESPQHVCALLNALVQKILVFHNATFDLFHLAKLYTISTRIPSYSFDEIWAAEAVFRITETSYEDRLATLYGFYPSAVVDTMLVAQHSLPLADEFLGGTNFELYNFPYNCIGQLKDAFSSAVAWQYLLKAQGVNDDLIAHFAMHDRIVIQVKNSKKKSNATALKLNPDKYAVTISISYNGRGIFSLKGLAKAYRYTDTDSITDFEFLNSFPRLEELNKSRSKYHAPTIASRDLYDSLYYYCRAGYTSTKFLEYAVRDILLLHFVAGNLSDESNFSPALQADLSLLPYFANLRLYGIKVDKTICANNRQTLSQDFNRQVLKLEKASPKLDKPSSSSCCLKWLRSILVTNKGMTETEALEAVPNTEKKTLNRLTSRIKDVEEFKDFIEYKRIEGVLKHMPGDTDSLFPEYTVYGTVTGRMTCSRPNAQQMPKDEFARSIFVPPASYALTIGDFDQLELRILAYLFNVSVLKKAFADNRDPHSQIAADMLHAEISKVLGEDISTEDAYMAIQSRKQRPKSDLNQIDKRVLAFRNVGKVVNFGTIYGMTPVGLSDQLMCDQESAANHIRRYFQVVPEVSAAMSDSDKAVSRLQLVTKYSYSKTFRTWECQRDPIPTVTTRFGGKRNFGIAHSMIRLMHFIKSKDYTRKHMKTLTKSYLDLYEKSLRAGFKRIDGSIKREAFNFRIQSTGSFFTKLLQSKICREFIPLGKITKLSSLELLPTLNVHDELHFYIKGSETKARLDTVKDRILDEINDSLDGKITLSFSNLSSWAEKN